MSTKRLFQMTGPATQNALCQIVALSWVQTNFYRQQNQEQKGEEQSKLACTVHWDNTVPGHGLPCTPEGKV